MRTRGTKVQSSTGSLAAHPHTRSANETVTRDAKAMLAVWAARRFASRRKEVENVSRSKEDHRQASRKWSDGLTRSATSSENGGYNGRRPD